MEKNKEYMFLFLSCRYWSKMVLFSWFIGSKAIQRNSVKGPWSSLQAKTRENATVGTCFFVAIVTHGQRENTDSL